MDTAVLGEDCRRAPKRLCSAQAAPFCSAGIERARKCFARISFCEMLSQYPRAAFRGFCGGHRQGQQQFATQTLRVHLLGIEKSMTNPEASPIYFSCHDPILVILDNLGVDYPTPVVFGSSARRTAAARFFFRKSAGRGQMRGSCGNSLGKSSKLRLCNPPPKSGLENQILWIENFCGHLDFAYTLVTKIITCNFLAFGN